MLLKSLHKKIIGAASIALLAVAGLSPNTYAQKGGTGVMNDEVAVGPTQGNEVCHSISRLASVPAGS